MTTRPQSQPTPDADRIATLLDLARDRAATDDADVHLDYVELVALLERRRPARRAAERHTPVRPR